MWNGNSSPLPWAEPSAPGSLEAVDILRLGCPVPATAPGMVAA
jgi:hypothetical protein